MTRASLRPLAAVVLLSLAAGGPAEAARRPKKRAGADLDPATGGLLSEPSSEAGASVKGMAGNSAPSQRSSATSLKSIAEWAKL